MIALVEFVVHAFTSAERLDEKYSAAGGAGVVAVIVAAAIGAIVLVGILAAIALPAYQDYTKRAQVSVGILDAGLLTSLIGQAFVLGPADMTCQRERCLPGDFAPALSRHVRSISSDRAGAITVAYDEAVLAAPNNRLTIVPLIDGRPADLSDPANAGRPVVWQCGHEGTTTIAARFLPASCRAR